MRIAINTSFGGFEVSRSVLKELRLNKAYGHLDNEDFGIESSEIYEYRTDSRLLEALEKIGEIECSETPNTIKIITIPDDIDWYIDDYDGLETVCEGRKWR